MVENEKKIVLICDDQAFLKLMEQAFEENYLVEPTDILTEEKLDKYRTQIKLVVEPLPPSEAGCACLKEKIQRFQGDERIAFLLICHPSQRKLAAEAVGTGAADVLFLPCEQAILRKRVSNVIKLMILKRQALRDPLTEVYNRRGFEKLVQRLLGESPKPAAFVMIDLDDFKHFNDRYGHHTGDQVLIQVASVLEQILDRKGVVGRLGGDEFAIFIPNIGSQEEFRRKLVQIFNQLEIQWLKSQEKVKVLSSMGISFFPEHGLSFSELYRRADEAQYRSKADGKHQICIYGE